MKYLSLLALSLLLPFMMQAQEDASTIVKKALEQFKGETSVAEMTMTIIRPTWQREVTMKSWTKGEDYSLIKILSPARDKGTGFLKRGKEIWNWQPTIERTIKLPPSMMSQSWMGSDFTNDDLVRESSTVTDYEHKILESTTIEGREAWKILLTPKPDAPVVWGKVILWITKDHYLELRAEFYDEEGELVNTMMGKDIQTMDGRVIPTTLEMIPADKENQKTVIHYSSVTFNKPIETDFFSLQNMKTVR